MVRPRSTAAASATLAVVLVGVFVAVAATRPQPSTVSSVDLAWSAVAVVSDSIDDAGGPTTSGPSAVAIGTTTTLSFLPSTTTAGASAGGSGAAILRSSGQNAGVQAVRVPGPPVNGVTRAPTVITLAGSLWDASVPAGGFSVLFCDVAGTSCDAPVGARIDQNLVTNSSGSLAGGAITVTRTSAAAALTVGSRSIRLVEGAKATLIAVQVLGDPALDIAPTGPPGTPVIVSGSNMNPGQVVNVRGFVQADPWSRDWQPSSDPGPATGLAASNGSFGPIRVVVNDAATTAIGAWQGSDTRGLSTATPRASIGSSVGGDRCVVWSAAGAETSCRTSQIVSVSVVAGSLVQRAYPSASPVNGSVDGMVVTMPIPGTAGAGADSITIQLGAITSPLAQVVVRGNMNDITVTDTRGGTTGWSLTATMTDFACTPDGTLPAGALTASPVCVPATAADAWDYRAAGRTPTTGFDPSFIAPGITAGPANQSFADPVNLCTKSGEVNPTTGSTGGVWNIGSPLALVVPAFQPAGTYTAVMTITLA